LIADKGHNFLGFIGVMVIAVLAILALEHSRGVGYAKNAAAETIAPTWAVAPSGSNGPLIRAFLQVAVPFIRPDGGAAF